MSGLPGRILKLSPHAKCSTDGHEERPSVKCKQGETDSFGFEEIDFCKECWDAHLAAPVALISGTCDWGKHQSDDLIHARDYEEGTSGPVYLVCRSCHATQVERFIEETRSLR